MADLYYSPVQFGIHDLNASGDSGSFGLRVYYPSDDESPENASIRADDYPLIVFAHGDRSLETGLCPQDATQDYKRWGAILHLLARCGFVVAVPNVEDVVDLSVPAALRIEDTVRWMRQQWVGNAVLHYPPVFTDIAATLRGSIRNPTAETEEQLILPGPIRPGFPGFPRPPLFLGTPTPLGLIGHSWGARACARVAVGGNVSVRALASLAGTWDENESTTALTSANVPTVLIVGTNDALNLPFLKGIWPSLPQPKHQAALQGVGHWDWFGTTGGVQACDPSTNLAACLGGWQIASELLLGFMTKHVRGHWYRPPYLLGSPGRRPPVISWFDGPVGCALKVRWDDPTVTTSLGNPGEVSLGSWTLPEPW